jgi:tetratricopeptide (TPR) repeat protein
MSLPTIATAIRVFFSYAATSRKDTQLVHRLRKQLSNVRRQQLIDDSLDSAQTRPAHLVRLGLDTAHIIVLLVSADYMDLDRCAQVELTRALERHDTEGISLVPVLAAPTELKGSPLEQLTFLPRDHKPVSARAGIGIEQALAEVAGEIHRIAERLAGSIQAGVPAETQPSLHDIPYMPNHFFTDREDILSTLYEYFTSHRVFTHMRIQALYGLEGVGKTQIAIEYAYRHRSLYRALIWLDAESGNLVNSIRDLAGRCGFSEQDCVDEAHLYAAFRRWLRQQDSWLLVLDGLGAFPLLSKFIPFESSGHVLVTTLEQAAGYLARPVPVTEMTEEDAARFLLRRVRLIDEHAGNNEIPQPTYGQAIAIVRELGGLTLALDQAGAYIEETRCGLDGYLRRYCRQGAQLLEWRGQQAHTHPDSVQLALSLTFVKVASLCPEAMHLLYLFAFLHPDTIPNDIIEQGMAALEGPLRVLKANPMLLDRAMVILFNFSLIQQRADTGMWSMHRVVQAVLKKRLTPKRQRRWTTQAVRLVSAVFPQPDCSNRAICEKYLSQARYCADVLTNLQPAPREAISLLHRLGSYCYRRAWYQKAEKNLELALSFCEQHADAESERAQVLNSLAMLYHRQGAYHVAETAYQRALEIRELAYGPDHRLVAQTLNDLALLYQDWGKYQQAERFYLRVLDIDACTLEPDHPDTAISLSNLALLYDLQGKSAQAEPLYQRAFSIEERILDARHPDWALSLNIQASQSATRGDNQEAEKLYQRALAVQEEVLGPAHPDTARTLTNLADLYEVQQRYCEAESLYLQALGIYTQVQGLDHPDVAMVLNNLAYLFRQQGQYVEAEERYQQALGIYERTSGLDHPETANVLNNLGWLYYLTQKDDLAEVCLRRVLDIRERVPGLAYPDTSKTLSTLAEVLMRQQRYAQAEPLYRRALQIVRQALHPEHPDAVLALERYTFLLAHIEEEQQNS